MRVERGVVYLYFVGVHALGELNERGSSSCSWFYFALRHISFSHLTSHVLRMSDQMTLEGRGGWHVRAPTGVQIQSRVTERTDSSTRDHHQGSLNEGAWPPEGSAAAGQGLRAYSVRSSISVSIKQRHLFGCTPVAHLGPVNSPR